MNTRKLETCYITDITFKSFAEAIHEKLNDGWVVQGAPFVNEGKFYVIMTRPVAVDISTIVPSKA